MVIIESMSHSEFEEIRDGILKWLELRQNQAVFSEKSPCETIEELIEDVKKSAEHDLLPWENE